MHRFAQIIQYIDLVKSDSKPGSHGEYYTTESGGQFPWLDVTDFEQDEGAGHGTHTAGSAAGATINTPANTANCIDPDVLSCVGGCISTSTSFDDLVSTYSQYFTLDLDRLCPMFDCVSNYPEEMCLSDDVAETLTEHGGMARGAKLAIFDVFHEEIGGLGSFAGNGVWEACKEAGCKLHSNSYGADLYCGMSEVDVDYDNFMYDVSSI